MTTVARGVMSMDVVGMDGGESRKRRWGAMEERDASVSPEPSGGAIGVGAGRVVDGGEGEEEARARKRSKRSRSKKVVQSDPVVAALVANTIVPDVVRRLKGLRIHGSQVTCWVDKRRGNTGKHLTRENVFYWQVQANRRHVFSGWHTPDEVVSRVEGVVAEAAVGGAVCESESPGRAAKVGVFGAGGGAVAGFGRSAAALPPASRPFHSLTFEFDANGVPVIEPYLAPLRFGGDPLVVYIHEDKGEHKKRKSVFFWTIVAGSTRLLHGWYSARTIVKRMRLACHEGPAGYKEGVPVKQRHLGSLYTPSGSPVASPTASPRTSPPPPVVRSARRTSVSAKLASAAAVLAAEGNGGGWRRPKGVAAGRAAAGRAAAVLPQADAVAYAERYFKAYMADPSVVQVEERGGGAGVGRGSEAVYELEPSYEADLLASSFWDSLSQGAAASPHAVAAHIERELSAAAASASRPGSEVRVVVDGGRGPHPFRRHTFYMRLFLRAALIGQGWYHPAQMLALVAAAGKQVPPAPPAPAPLLSPTARAYRPPTFESAPPSPSFGSAPSDSPPAEIDAAAAELNGTVAHVAVDGGPVRVARLGAETWQVAYAGGEIEGRLTPSTILAAVAHLADPHPDAHFPHPADVDARIAPFLPLLKRAAAAIACLTFRGHPLTASVRLARGAYPLGTAVAHWTVRTPHAALTSGWLSLPALIAAVRTHADAEPNNSDAFFAAAFGFAPPCGAVDTPLAELLDAAVAALA